MKATELKIGDWVLCNSEPLRVAESDLFACSAWGKDEDIHYEIYYEDLTPIPLTSEILEKNGWHKQASNHEMQGWSNGHVKLYPQGEKFDGGFMLLYSGNAVRYIHHVHELQHLLWALGIDDDLKI